MKYHIVQQFRIYMASASVSSPSFIARNGADEVEAAHRTIRVVAQPTVQAAAMERMGAAKRGPRDRARVGHANGTSFAVGCLPCLKFWEFFYCSNFSRHCKTHVACSSHCRPVSLCLSKFRLGTPGPRRVFCSGHAEKLGI